MASSTNEKSHMDHSEKFVEDSIEVHEQMEEEERAAIVGPLLVAASNLYLGLKIGWTFGAALWGSRITGSIFGPKENAVCQAAATSAGGLSNGFVTAILAMYRMGLRGDNKPQDDVVAPYSGPPLLPSSAYLVFPTPRAAAETIKNLHGAGSATAKDARDSGRAMIISFTTAMIWSIIGFFISGIFGTVHILYFIGKAANYTNMMDADLIAFGIAGPLMTSSGYLTGHGGFPPPPAVGSAQSWFLWPGVGMMVFTAFSELGAHGASLYHGIKGGVREIRNMIRKLQKKEALVDTSDYVSKDTTPEHELIPTTWWLAIILSFLPAFVGLQASGETDINPTGAVAKVTQLEFSRIPNSDPRVVQKTNLMCTNIVASVVDMYRTLSVPSAVAWENVCKILTGDGKVPRESMILNAVGLGFINPSPSIVFTMMIGWIAGWLWKRVNIGSHERLMYSVSAGLIAGVGIAGLINTAMTIGGVEEGRMWSPRA
ncbi:MAG: hypothetical protein J3Q66DRAFT_400855 [Benniella sp.]|nr:MAG: hypothetical protein J3Q66DRAFT_400855 [Benniella sp.]